MMKKLIKYAISLNFLRKVFGWEIFGEAIRSSIQLTLLDDPQNLLPPKKSNLKILILAPHPDDDVFGCGGVMAMHNLRQDDITCLYFCDGSKGNPQGIRDSRLAARRKNESQNAAKILRTKTIFWGYKDGNLAAERTSITALTNLINDLMPDIIYLPNLLDNHSDHEATNDILYNALFAHRGIRHSPKLIVMYEIWTPTFSNRVINITNVIDIKKKAIGCHQSQLKSRGYDKAIVSLNSYRAQMNGIDGFAEAFFAATPKIYKKLYNIKN